MGQVLLIPVLGVPFDEVDQAPAEGFPVPVVDLRRPHELQGHPVCLVDVPLLAFGEYIGTCGHPLMPSVSSKPTSPTKEPGEQAVISGWHFVNWSFPLYQTS
ncbi:hypothetical protein D3C80_1778300 [compost metagenome]